MTGLRDSRVADLVESMTLEEKVAQLSCIARACEAPWLVDGEDRFDSDALVERFPSGVGQLGRPSQKLDAAAAAEMANDIQTTLGSRNRLGIGALLNEEGVHGHMAIGATSYPSAIALASTWNTELIGNIFSAIAREVRSRGSNYVYAPVLDLARDARWGRFEETFGEDPHLVARMGVTSIVGLQGSDWAIPDDKVLACAKHFAGHGMPEAGMNAAPARVGMREMLEEHLPPFEAAVREANVGALMVAYHEIDGVPCHANAWLLTRLLREEWGFEGMVSSDGFGVPQLATVHNVAHDEAEAASLALTAGVDCEIPEGTCFSTLVSQVEAGAVPMEAIDRAVINVLLAKDRLGLLGEVTSVDPEVAMATVNHPDHRELALDAARESAILLTNDGDVLPLATGSLASIAVIGPHAADLHLGGYAEDPGKGVSVLDGIRQRAGANAVSYAEGCRVTEGPQGAAAWWTDRVELSDPLEQNDRIAEAATAATKADVAILVIGGNEGTAREGWSEEHVGDRDSLDLPGRQNDLVAAVAGTGTPIVAVVMGGRPLDLATVIESCTAVIQVWYPGQEGGTAIAEILFGDVVPSGKLPVTMPRSVGQIPVYLGRKPSADRGYLFTSHEPLFPFGHGLSYTTFAYGTPTVTPTVIPSDGTVSVAVDVSNTGTRSGTEVVQCYIHDRVASVTRPRRALRGFERVHLDPGQTRTVTFELAGRDLALVDLNMEWTVEAGEFDVFVGGSSSTTNRAVLTVRRN